MFKLRLYVNSDNSGQALSFLYKALEHHSYCSYELEIIDVMQQPEEASADGVVKTPTLVSLLCDGGMIISDNLEDIQRIRKIFRFKDQTLSSGDPS